MSNYNPNPNQGTNYLTSDWGSSHTKHTAFQIDALSEKAQFAIHMLESVVDGFDTIEKEIMEASNASVPITREGLRAFAYRVDGQQNQIKQTLQHLKQMMTDIGGKTDNIQRGRTNW